jgi:hypothetical protein
MDVNDACACMCVCVIDCISVCGVWREVMCMRCVSHVQRYVGNILAWIHHAVAGELEFLGALGFSLAADRETAATAAAAAAAAAAVVDSGDSDSDGKQGGARSGEKKEEKDLGTASLLGRVFDGVARSLKMRADQALEASPNELVLYKVGNTALFYISMLEDKFQPDSQLLVTLRELAASSLTMFLSQVRVCVRV